MEQDDSLLYTYRWFINRFDEAAMHAKKLYATTRPALFYRKPAPKKWSAAECINHLIQFGTIYSDKTSRAIEQATRGLSASAEPFKPRLFWRGIIRLFEPPYKIKMSTISIFEPATQNDPHNHSLVPQFQKLQARFIDQTKRCQKKNISLNENKIKNPALPFLKMTLSESYGVVLAHQRRHLWQAEQTLDKLQENGK